MPRKTWLKRALWVGALASAAALAPGCAHSREAAERGTGGAGDESTEPASLSTADRSEQRDITSRQAQSRECLPQTGSAGLPEGSGGAGTEAQISSNADPYCLPPNAGTQQDLQKLRRVHPEENPKGEGNPNLQPGRPYIEPFGPELNPNSVGGAGGG